MSELKIEQKNDQFVLSGVLDENSDLTPLAEAKGKIVIDFNGIVRVNSGGVREWIKTIKDMPTHEMVYINCPINIVKQLNTVPGFLGQAKVKTFRAPYYCRSCQEEVTVLLKNSDVKKSEAPQTPCPKCKTRLEFDSIASQYFSFLKRS